MRDSGFKPFLRSDFLDVLRSEADTSDSTVVDFIKHLETQDARIKSCFSEPVATWIEGYFPWMGLYEWLQDQIEDPGFGWDYVPNPRGGFLGAWWHFRDWIDGSTIYLQIEQKKLCFKLGVEDRHEDAEPSELRASAWAALSACAAHRELVISPMRRRLGKSMTLGYANADQWLISAPSGLLDRLATLSRLEEAAKVVDCVSQSASQVA